MIFFSITHWIFTGVFPENPVEIRKTLKSAAKTSFRDILAIDQSPPCLVDPVLIEEGDEGDPGHFFKIPAESFPAKVGDRRDFGQVNFAVVLLIDKVVHLIEPALVFLVPGIFIRLGMQELIITALTQEVEDFDHLLEKVEGPQTA